MGLRNRYQLLVTFLIFWIHEIGLPLIVIFLCSSLFWLNDIFEFIEGDSGNILEIIGYSLSPAILLYFFTNVIPLGLKKQKLRAYITNKIHLINLVSGHYLLDILQAVNDSDPNQRIRKEDDWIKIVGSIDTDQQFSGSHFRDEQYKHFYEFHSAMFSILNSNSHDLLQVNDVLTKNAVKIITDIESITSPNYPLNRGVFYGKNYKGERKVSDPYGGIAFRLSVAVEELKEEYNTAG